MPNTEHARCTLCHRALRLAEVVVDLNPRAVDDTSVGDGVITDVESVRSNSASRGERMVCGSCAARELRRLTKRTSEHEEAATDIVQAGVERLRAMGLGFYPACDIIRDACGVVADMGDPDDDASDAPEAKIEAPAEAGGKRVGYYIGVENGEALVVTRTRYGIAEPVPLDEILKMSAEDATKFHVVARTRVAAELMLRRHGLRIPYLDAEDASVLHTLPL